MEKKKNIRFTLASIRQEDEIDEAVEGFLRALGIEEMGADEKAEDKDSENQ